MVTFECLPFLYSIVVEYGSKKGEQVLCKPDIIGYTTIHGIDPGQSKLAVQLYLW